MKKISFIALCLHGLSWGSAEEETFPEANALSIPRSLMNKWIAHHEGKDFTVEFLMNRNDRHFTFSLAKCKTPPDPSTSLTTAPSLCPFVLTKEVTSYAIGTLTYTDPVTGHTLYLIP